MHVDCAITNNPCRRQRELKSTIFPCNIAYTSRPPVPMTCDRISSRPPLTTDVDLPTFSFTKNWTFGTGWNSRASKVPDWTQLLAPSNAATALVASTVSTTTAFLTSLRLMMGLCLSVQSWRSTGAQKFSARVPYVVT